MEKISIINKIFHTPLCQGMYGRESNGIQDKYKYITLLLKNRVLAYNAVGLSRDLEI